ncbi:MAG: hypothetical protein KF833_06130 [Verrucomicrobiae bacterium]|nr:hypothetical protein [Verrucomicrobiae bacterium]
MWLLLACGPWGLPVPAASVYPNPSSPDPYRPANLRLYGSAQFVDVSADGIAYHYLYPGHENQPGMVLIDLPGSGRTAPDAFTVEFVLAKRTVILDRAFSFNFGNIGASDLASGSGGAGNGLTISFVGEIEKDIVQTHIQAKWGGALLGSAVLRILPVAWTISYEHGHLNITFLDPE